MRVRAVVLSALALAVVASPVRADLVSEHVSLQYNAGAKRWDFLTDTFIAGSVNIVSNGIAKKLAKLKESGSVHSCIATYDSDSKIAATNGDFFLVTKLSKCDL